MAKSKSTRAVVDKGLRQIDRDLRACRQTLMCAVEALARAEDDGFKDEALELGVSAVHVVRRCARELMRIEEAVDQLNLDVVHS